MPMPLRHLTTPTPRALNFTQPAEWTPHAATWTSWPADNELWFGQLEWVRQEFTALIQTIARFESVHLLVRDGESEQDARARLSGTPVTYHRVPLDDVWFRDNGPIFVTRASETKNEVSFVHWKFNAWGNKFHWQNDTQAPEALAEFLQMDHWDLPIVMEGGSLEPNGAGVALTTRQCLMEQGRNPRMTQEDLERVLNDHLGFEKLLWLENGLEGDHTDGHIDTITRFVDERTIVTSVCQPSDTGNYQTLQDNLERLKTFTDLQNKPFRIVELPLPQNRLENSEGRLACTYANFYIGNGFVVVPLYGDPLDSVALEILTPLFPGRETIGLSSRAIIEGGGSFHCVTQQQPVGRIWTLDSSDER